MQKKADIFFYFTPDPSPKERGERRESLSLVRRAGEGSIARDDVHSTSRLSRNL